MLSYSECHTIGLWRLRPFIFLQAHVHDVAQGSLLHEQVYILKKILSMVPLHSKWTRALTSENLCLKKRPASSSCCYSCRSILPRTLLLVTLLHTCCCCWWCTISCVKYTLLHTLLLVSLQHTLLRPAAAAAAAGPPPFSPRPPCLWLPPSSSHPHLFSSCLCVCVCARARARLK